MKGEARGNPGEGDAVAVTVVAAVAVIPPSAAVAMGTSLTTFDAVGIIIASSFAVLMRDTGKFGVAAFSAGSASRSG